MIAKAVVASDGIKEVTGTTQADRLHTMRREGLIEDEILDIFHLLRKKVMMLFIMQVMVLQKNLYTY